MLEKKLQIGYEYFPSTHSFTVHKETLIVEDDNEISRSVHSRAFTPGMKDELAQYIGDSEHPLISYCNKIWTQESN